MAVLIPPEPLFADVDRIVVLRGGGLGDLLVALPAIDALAAAYPEAQIVLLGTPGHAALLAERPSAISRVEVLPVAPGIREAAPGASPRPEDDPVRFRQRMLRLGPIDLGVQLHGGGRYSNPFLRSLSPRHTVGLMTPDAEPLDRSAPYVYYQHEVLRWLEVVALAGAVPVSLEPRLRVTPSERRAVAELQPTAEPLAVVHPGASDPRRRWPAERFAAVAAGLLGDGAHVRIVGDAGDAGIAREIADRSAALARLTPEDARARVHSVAGRLTIGETAALLATADVVVANDSGPRHLAQAVGAATVGIFWFGNVVNAGPFTRTRHRVHLSFTTACPVCGVDVTQVGWTAERCEHDDSFVADVAVGPVLDDARQLMATSSPRSARPAARGSRSLRAG